MSIALSFLSRRRGLRIPAVGLVALGLLLWGPTPWREDPPSGSVTLSTGTHAGVYQKYGELLHASLGVHMPDLEVRLLTSDGSQENLRRVATGQAEFAIAAADAVETYKLDSRPGAGELRGVARLYDDYVQLVVPPGSDIRSVADLRGRNVAIGPPKSGVRLIANQVLRAAGIDPEKDISPSTDGIDSGPGRLGKGLDAFFWSGGLPTDGLRTLSEVSGLRFVPITAELIAEVHEQGGATRYYRAINMPESAYPSSQHGSTVPTMAVPNLLITRADTDARLTEWLTQIVLKSRDNIGAHVHSAQLVDVRTAIYTDPLRLHEGARRYYRSVKP